MSIQEQFHGYKWLLFIVCAIVLSYIAAVTVGLPCNICWEITKTKILNFLFRICPCLETIAHPDAVDERRSPGLNREEDDRFTDLEDGQAEIRTALVNVVEQNQVVNAKLDALYSLVSKSNNILFHRQSPLAMEMSTLPLSIGSSSSGAQPSNSTVVVDSTFYLPNTTPLAVYNFVMDFLGRHARKWIRWRGSIVIQASLPIDSSVLAEIGELVKECCSLENGFTLQIASWGIFYHKDDRVHLLLFEEGAVPMNNETRENRKRTGLTMFGVYLNGAQIKATTERTSTTLRSTGPPSKGCGNLDELHFPFPMEELEGVEKSFFHAAKVIEFDGISLVVRSEASYAVPPKSFLEEILEDGLLKIPTLAMKMTKPALESIPDLKTQQQLLVEYWKGVSQMEMIDCRNKIIIQLQNLPASEISTSNGAQSVRFITMCPSSRDKEYWQRALHDLSEDNLSIGSSSLSSTIYSTGGRIKFLLGNFESALLDFDRAANSTTEGFATTLLDRAMVKCALARYQEATQDINKAAEINPNSYDIKRFQACLEDILCMDSLKSLTLLLQPTLPVYDLLTGDHYPNLESPRYYGKMPPIFKIMEEFGFPSLLDWTEVIDLSKNLPELNLQRGTSHNRRPPFICDEIREACRIMCIMTGDDCDSLHIGKKLAEGGQAEIFEALGPTPLSTRLVLKVLKHDFTLRTSLQPGVLQFGGDYLDHPSPFLCTALGVKFLKDGRCAFVFPRHWGDLRCLIHLHLDIHSPRYNPFEFLTSVKIMLQIAEGMRSLHIRNILHRDLKASNILVSGDNPDGEDFGCVVADFECSVGVVGTSFWRAPEILTQLNHQTSEPKALAWSKEADVYSFGMICYEILTGHPPFGDLRAYSDYDVVLSGNRPHLPLILDSKLRALIVLCWDADPKHRPSFSKICKVLADVKGNAAEPPGHLQTHKEWADLT